MYMYGLGFLQLYRGYVGIRLFLQLYRAYIRIRVHDNQEILTEVHPTPKKLGTTLRRPLLPRRRLVTPDSKSTLVLAVNKHPLQQPSGHNHMGVSEK